MTRQRSMGFRVTIALALTVTILLILESLSRIVLTVRADLASQEPTWSQYASDVGWERRPLFKGVIVGERYGHHPVQPMREFDAHGYFSVDTAQIQDTTHKRILAIGDSNTFGWGVPTNSAFPEVLDELREDADVINLGVSGYTSWQGYGTLVKHFTTIRPDLVIASFSFNDRRVVPSDQSIDSREKFESEARSHEFDFLRRKVYLFRVLQAFISQLAFRERRTQTDFLVDLRSAKTVSRPSSIDRIWSGLHGSVGNGRSLWCLSYSRIIRPNQNI